MKFLEYNCFKPPQPDLDYCKNKYAWYPLFADGLQPTQRSSHAVCMFKNKIFMYGGRGHKGTLNQFWLLDSENLQWSVLSSSGECPPRLEGHSMIVYEENIYVFGGETSFASADESPLWSYDVKESVWLKITSNGNTMQPSGRRQHTAVLYMDVMCVYGGYQDLIGPTKEMWLFDLETKSWHFDVAASNEMAPDGRYGHSAAVNGQSMWICGGLTGLKSNSEVLVWNFELMNWISVKTKGGPSEISGHTMCLVDRSLFLFGGCDTNGKVSDEMWKLPIDDPTWRKCHCKELKPPAVSGHSIILLHSPSLLKKDFRTRSLPDVKRKKALKESGDPPRSLSCDGLSNKSSKQEQLSMTGSVSSSSVSDKASLVSSSKNKSDYAYDNPLMSNFSPELSGSSSISVNNTVKGNITKSKGEYVSSRMRFGNITNGRSLKIFSYNLIGDSMQEDKPNTNLFETSFIDISKSLSSHLCITDVSTGNVDTSKRNGFPVVTHVKPISPDHDNSKDMELEEINKGIENVSGNSISINDIPIERQSFNSARSHSHTFTSRIKKGFVGDQGDDFVMLVLGGNTSSLNHYSSKQFFLWQCNM